MRAHRLSWLGLLLFCTSARGPDATPAATVRPGIEVLLSDSVSLIRGRRLGLLSNHTGLDRSGRRDVDALLAAGHRVVALFSPEHGFRGTEDRMGLPDAVDSATRLPIYSLYGGSGAAELAALDSLDVVLVDLQDIGARYYTYPATTASLMRDAAKKGKRVIILDRPDPIDGVTVQGNVRDSIADPDSSFVGFLPVPMRHGMTLGEIARMVNDRLQLHADLVVVPAAGWRREAYYDATGLPWVRPSPNMPSLESAIHYPGTCLFEGTNLSVGRGTAFAFQIVGAPWLDAPAVARRLQALALPGVTVAADTFTPRHPTDGRYDGVQLRGIRFTVTDRTSYDPTHAAVALLATLHALQPGSLRFRDESFDRLAAGPALRLAILSGASLERMWRDWDDRLARFRDARAKYLLY